jgi:hypothetical protein
LVKGFPRTALWPVAVAVFARLAAWAFLSDGRFASDEQGYVEAGMALATTGRQDLFWPPLTGWIVAAMKTIAPSASLGMMRLVWIAFDVANLILIALLADRIARAALPERQGAFVRMATLAYALYLPAISHAQFITSEMPALLLLLSSLVVLTSGSHAVVVDAGAGVLLGLLALARANLAPLALLMPAAALVNSPRAQWLRRSIVVAAIAGVMVAGAIVRNWIVYGEPTLSHNAAYNLYIGNRDVYAEDLNLFDPRATPEQIEFRRQFFAGTLKYPEGTAAELQQAAFERIAAHPIEFARRATGRLARVFAPKTDVLELAGGEGGVGVFSLPGLALLGTAAAQWAWLLFAGVPGLAALFDRDRRWSLTLLSTIAGSVALCLIAIAKPRYSFVFDPLLILCATLFTLLPAADRAATWREHRKTLIAALLFLAWAWIAWTIFAVTSRQGQ